MSLEDPIPVMLRFYSDRRASTSFTIEPESLKQFVKRRRTGFWLYALVKPGTRVHMRCMRGGTLESKVVEIREPGMITSDGFLTPMPREAGIFKRLFRSRDG